MIRTQQHPLGPQSKELIQQIEFKANELIGMIESNMQWRSGTKDQAILKVREAVLWSRQAISEELIGR